MRSVLRIWDLVVTVSILGILIDHLSNISNGRKYSTYWNKVLSEYCIHISSCLCCLLRRQLKFCTAHRCSFPQAAVW